jgi:Zinc dependent phospholipase C
MRRFLVPFLALTFVILMPQTALPLGNAPTHFSIGNDLVNNSGYTGLLPASDNPNLFIRANVCPDLAWTQTFKTAGLGYVHTSDFAEALYDVAQSYPWKSWKPNWRTIARAYGAHFAADGVFHSTFLANVGELIHSLVEVSVDTLIFFNGTPLDPSTPPLDWENINVGYDACDPYLFILASRRYREKTGQAVPTIQWGNMLVAVPELASAIAAEYTYHKLKGNTDLSEAYLQNLVNQGVLPGGYESYYLNSLEAAADWIQVHQ